MESDTKWTVAFGLVALVIAVLCAAVTCSNYMNCHNGVMVKTMWGTYDCVPKGN